MRRPLYRFMLVILVAGFSSAPVYSLAADEHADRPVTLQPQSRTAEDVFTSLDAAPLGLRRPPAQSLRDRIELPMNLHYNRNTKSLLMPLDEKNEWGVGINLDVGAPPTELSPPGLQLAPKRTPGVTLHRSF